jgi:hypothetical protein
MNVVLDPDVGRDVAEAHHAAARRTGPECDAAYARLVDETDRLYRVLPVEIGFTMSEHPYDSADELIRSVRHDRILEVTSVAWERDRPHPLMGCEVGGEYDRSAPCTTCSATGTSASASTATAKYATWRFQERFHSPRARRALATELHAEHSVRWTTGELPEHKAVLLDERVVARSRAGG